MGLLLPFFPASLLTLFFPRLLPWRDSDKDVRVGISEAYGVLFKLLGPRWLEANQAAIIQHIVGLASNPKTGSSVHEETASRECFGYILKAAFDKYLNEEAKLNAIKELVTILKLYPPTAPTDPGPSKQALVVVLNQLADLFQDLGHAIVPIQDSILDPLLGVSGHPAFSVRQAVAWCFRTLALATPANLSKYLAQLIQATKASHGKVASDKPDTLGRLRGHSICLSALVACIPHCLLHVSFVVPEEILAFAVKIGAETNPDSGIVLVFQEVSWALLAALTCLGPSFIKSHLAKYVNLWQAIFSKNTKDANVSDEDWKNTVRARECALACLEFFLKNCFQLLTTDLSKKITNYLNTSLVFLALVPSNKMFSDHILKMRLFHCFLSLPPSSYELSHVPLLRSIVETFTNSNTTGDAPTSLFFTQSNRQDATLFGWNFESDEEQVERQLQFALTGAIEYDPHIVCGAHERFTPRPTPVPPEIAVVDSAIELFEKIFPIQQHQTQEQVLEGLVKSFKGRANQKKYCLQVNTFTAVMGALKNLMNRKSSLSRGKVSALLQELIQSVLTHQDGTLRYAAAETLGRLTGVVGGQFVSSLVKSLLDNLISSSEPTSKAGYVLAVGCVMRYVGGMGASSHLQAAVGILLSLSSDPNPVIYTWAIHSLWIAIDSAGLMFQPFVTSTLALVSKLFLLETHEATYEKEYFPDLNVSVGRLLSSLMVALGPELQTSRSAREVCLSIYSELENEREQAVVSEAIRCVQQLILFSPSSVDIGAIVPVLQAQLENTPLSIRKASYVCLRQLIQREPKAVNAAANTLEEQLYASFDSETNEELAEFIREMILELLAATAVVTPSRWVDLTRLILTSAGPKPKEEGDKDDGGGEEEEQEPDDDGGDDDGDGPRRPRGASMVRTEVVRPKYSLPSAPRWQTKVFAVENVRRVLLQIAAAKPGLVKVHFNLGPARDVRAQGNRTDFVIFRLNELIRIAFNAATSPVDGLHTAGLDCLQEVIERFAPSEDPDFEEHSIMEQYQAQISAALRPAFAPESSPDILSRGCAVTALYIRSGVISEVADLKRVVQLLTTLLDKFKEEQETRKPVEGLTGLSPHAHLIVKLAVLTAWAELYVATSSKPALMDVVEPYLSTLSKLWVQLLCDFAEIKVGKISPAVREVVLPFFRDSWVKLLEAISRSDETKLSAALRGDADQDGEEQDTSRTFFIIFALCVEALFEGDSVRISSICLTALEKLLKPWLVGETFFDKDYFVELLSVLNRMAQTDEGLLYVPVIKLIKQIVNDHSNVLFSDPVSLFGSPAKPSAKGGNDAKIHNLVRILTTLLLRHIPGASATLGFSVPPTRVDEAQSIVVVNSALEALTTMITLAPAKYQADLAPVYFVLLTSVLATDSRGLRAGCAPTALQSLRAAGSKLAVPEAEDTRRLLLGTLQRTLLSFFSLAQAEMSRLQTAPKEAVAALNTLLLASVLISTTCPLLALSKETIAAEVQVISAVLALGVEELSQTALHCARSLIQLLGKPETSPFGATFAKSLIPEVVIVFTGSGKGAPRSETLVTEAIKVLTSSVPYLTEPQSEPSYYHYHIIIIIIIIIILGVLTGKNSFVVYDRARDVLDHYSDRYFPAAAREPDRGAHRMSSAALANWLRVPSAL